MIQVKSSGQKKQRGDPQLEMLFSNGMPVAFNKVNQQQQIKLAITMRLIMS